MADGEALLGGEGQNPRRQLEDGQPSQVAFDRGAKVRRLRRHGQNLIRKKDGRPGRGFRHLQGYGFAPK